jgi:FkbM family methyltransferase
MKVLVYCGLNKGGSFKRMVNSGKFDICYGFEANPELFSELQESFPQKNVKLYNFLLSEKDGNEVDFYIQDANGENNYFASSVGKVTEEYHDNTTNKITSNKSYKLKTVNLYNFLKKEGVEHIEFLLTDLEGSDLSVLKTLKPLIDSKKINYIQSEVEPDHKPQKYSGLNNKLSGFKEVLGNSYELDWYDSQGVDRDWFSVDYRWRVTR